jgi:parallel beta-helix repeat protein
MLLALLIGTLNLASRVEKAKASGTIYIRADGSVEPEGTPISTFDNVTYTFAGNINDSIVVERNNIVVDGAGYTLQGQGSGGGIVLSYGSNVTIKNMEIEAFEYGIYLFRSCNNSIFGNLIKNNEWYAIYSKQSNFSIFLGNNITNNHDGIILCESSIYNRISENNITANKQYGVWLYENSSYNSLSGNNLAANRYAGVTIYDSSNNSIVGNTFTNDGFLAFNSSGNNVEGNVVNDKPLVYLEGVSNLTVDEAGQVVLVDCDSIRVENLDLSNTAIGVYLQATNNSKILNNKIRDTSSGITIAYCSSNTISGNNITGSGIIIGGSSNTSVSGNILANSYRGLALVVGSRYNNVIGNNIINNEYGISIEDSPGNAMIGNNITGNWRIGVEIYCSGNSIFHNNFVNNAQQVHYGRPDYVNYWDDGYPSGGNYWSSYTGVDVKSGSYQNETGSDGIGDTPYIIYANNADRYPLMGMFYGFNVSTFWIEPGYDVVELISNSSVSAFDVGFWIEHPEDPNTRIIKFNVTGETGTAGFCRVCIPTALLNAPYTVLFNSTEIPCTLLPCSNSTHSYLYFNYTHSTEEVIIIPEFPSFRILPLFMIATILTVIVYRRKEISGTP